MPSCDHAKSWMKDFLLNWDCFRDRMDEGVSRNINGVKFVLQLRYIWASEFGLASELVDASLDTPLDAPFLSVIERCI